MHLHISWVTFLGVSIQFQGLPHFYPISRPWEGGQHLCAWYRVMPPWALVACLFRRLARAILPWRAQCREHGQLHTVPGHKWAQCDPFNQTIGHWPAKWFHSATDVLPRSGTYLTVILINGMPKGKCHYFLLHPTMVARNLPFISHTITTFTIKLKQEHWVFEDRCQLTREFPS
jgi:hypothetical protein